MLVVVVLPFMLVLVLVVPPFVLMMVLSTKLVVMAMAFLVALPVSWCTGLVASENSFHHWALLFSILHDPLWISLKGFLHPLQSKSWALLAILALAGLATVLDLRELLASLHQRLPGIRALLVTCGVRATSVVTVVRLHHLLAHHVRHALEFKVASMMMPMMALVPMVLTMVVAMVVAFMPGVLTMVVVMASMPGVLTMIEAMELAALLLCC